MRLRQNPLLPGWPALLVVPVFLALWAALRFEVGGRWGPWTFVFGNNLILDLSVALAGAWLFALAVDHLILRLMRARRMKKRGPRVAHAEPEGGASPNTPTMTGHPTRALLSLKSVVVIVVVASLFVWANSVERSPDLGQFERGMQLTYYLRSHARTQRVDPATRQPVGEVSVSAEGMEYILVTRLVIDVAIALTVSLALALASERFIFRRVRHGLRPEVEETV